MEDKQKTGAKILAKLDDILSRLMYLEEHVNEAERNLEARIDNVTERMLTIEAEVRDLDFPDSDQLIRDVGSILEQMPDLQIIVQDMERRERAYMHQKPAF